MIISTLNLLLLTHATPSNHMQVLNTGEVSAFISALMTLLMGQYFDALTCG